MSARFASVAGVGSALPERVVPNAEFASFLDTNDEWIRERTGIRERRFAAEGEATSDLATAAARRAVRLGGIGRGQGRRPVDEGRGGHSGFSKRGRLVHITRSAGPIAHGKRGGSQGCDCRRARLLQ